MENFQKVKYLPKNFLYGQNLLADKNNNNKKFPFVYE